MHTSRNRPRLNCDGCHYLAEACRKRKGKIGGCQTWSYQLSTVSRGNLYKRSELHTVCFKFAEGAHCLPRSVDYQRLAQVML